VTALRDAALEYTRRGLAVFPVHHPRAGGCSCGRAACSDAGKHPVGRLAPHGFKSASRERGPVTAWWDAEPKANIAIVTGGDIAVLDVDPRNGGDETLRRLLAEHGALPDTATSATGGNGTHYWFRKRRMLRSGKLGPGLDLKADGGYVLVPPSLHVSGRVYTWLVTLDHLVLLPAWIAARAGEPPVPRRPPARAVPLDPDDPLLRFKPRDYIEALAGIDTGGAFKIACPLPDHDDRTPSFCIYPTATEGWYCYGCDRGGGIYQFAALLDPEARFRLPLRGTDFLAVRSALHSFYNEQAQGLL
jgi:hypothetical protein